MKEKEENKKLGAGRWIRKTSLTILLILIIIVVCIGINLAVENANFSDIDVTKDKVYSLSQKSQDIAKSIDKDITIMLINMDESEEDFWKKYGSLNDKIKIDVIDDLASRTDLTDKYGITADTQAIIVQSGDREKILSSADLYTIDYSTYQTKDTTEEALTNAKNMLNDNGVVLTNIISSLEGEDSDFIKYEYATYKAVFDDVKIFMELNSERTDRQNLILVGIKGEPQIDETKYEEYKKYLDRQVTEFETDKQIVTDDFAPIGN